MWKWPSCSLLFHWENSIHSFQLVQLSMKFSEYVVVSSNQYRKDKLGVLLVNLSLTCLQNKLECSSLWSILSKSNIYWLYFVLATTKKLNCLGFSLIHKSQTMMKRLSGNKHSSLFFPKCQRQRENVLEHLSLPESDVTKLFFRNLRMWQISEVFDAGKPC